MADWLLRKRPSRLDTWTESRQIVPSMGLTENISRILSVQREATCNDARLAYRTLAVSNHPDQATNQGQATAHRQQLNAAYQNSSTKYTRTRLADQLAPAQASTRKSADPSRSRTTQDRGVNKPDRSNVPGPEYPSSRWNALD